MIILIVTAPMHATVVNTLPNAANVLNVVGETDNKNGDVLIASTSDRLVNMITLPSLELRRSWSARQDAPVLAQLILHNSYHVSASMSGSLILADMADKVISMRKDHTKYIVALAFLDDAQQPLLASAAWDNTIKIYALGTRDKYNLEEPMASLTLPTKPEAIQFTRHSENGEPVLIVTRTDSSHLHFYLATSEPRLIGRQNLAPHSNAWVAFTPASIALCPTDDSLLAIATNSTPHMKLIIVKLLLPSNRDPAPVPQTAREQALAQQAIADREHDAIKLHCNTMSAQTPYSSPLVIWRPSGKGVWVNSDDGLIRGIDILSGKTAAELRGHEPGTKVRTLWAGEVTNADGTQSEMLASGGFDHKLILWRP